MKHEKKKPFCAQACRQGLTKCMGTGWPKCMGKGWPKCMGKGKPKQMSPGWPKYMGKGWPKCMGKGWPKYMGKGWPKCIGKGWPKQMGSGWPTSSGACRITNEPFQQPFQQMNHFNKLILKLPPASAAPCCGPGLVGFATCWKIGLFWSIFTIFTSHQLVRNLITSLLHFFVSFHVEKTTPLPPGPGAHFYQRC